MCVVPMTGCAKWSVPLFMIEWMTSPRMIHDQKSGINNVHRSKPSHDSSAAQTWCAKCQNASPTDNEKPVLLCSTAESMRIRNERRRRM